MEKDWTTIILVGIILLIICTGIIFGIAVLKPKNNKEEIVKNTTETTTTKTTAKQPTAQKAKAKSNVQVLSSKHLRETTQRNIQYHKNNPYKNSVNPLTKMFLSVYLTFLLIILLLVLLNTVCFWKIYSDNNQPGWASIVPIYNNMILYRIVGINEMYAFLVFIPFVGFLISMILYYYALFLLTKKYNKSFDFYLGLLFLTPIFLFNLAFSKRNNNDVFFEK